ncbi:MAG TPA: LytTR family DNA-binding domain-containing protein [Allosphingosinicella sp.]
MDDRDFMVDGAMGAGAARDERKAGGDQREASGAAGSVRGPSGFSRRGAVRGFLVIAAFLVLVDTINVFTALNDAAQRGSRLAAWEPAGWEATSGIATLLACGIVYAALTRAPPGRTRWPILAAVHLAASLAFSGMHILLMNLMRVTIYAARGLHYRFGASGFLYEYRKDLIAYVVIAGIFWLFAGPRARAAPSAAPSPPPRRLFDIADGNRVLRVPVEEIAALHAAGNYVEFLLADGRRPLMRGSLAEIHERVGAGLFVRTHRSWAVNLGHVRGLRPARSGDFQIDLDGGATVPLSRRFPDALARLREGPGSAQSPSSSG